MKLLPLSQGQFAQVDDEDYERCMQYKWSAYKNKKRKDGSWYAARNISSSETGTGKRGHQFLHRFIMNETDHDVFIDHRDHNGLSNQKYNLRKCNKNENIRHQRARTGGTSELKNVTFHKQRQKWVVVVCVDGDNRHRGIFPKDQEELAGECADFWCAYHHKEFAVFNFPNRILKMFL